MSGYSKDIQNIQNGDEVIDEIKLKYDAELERQLIHEKSIKRFVDEGLVN